MFNSAEYNQFEHNGARDAVITFPAPAKPLSPDPPASWGKATDPAANWSKRDQDTHQNTWVKPTDPPASWSGLTPLALALLNGSVRMDGSMAFGGRPGSPQLNTWQKPTDPVSTWQ